MVNGTLMVSHDGKGVVRDGDEMASIRSDVREALVAPGGGQPAPGGPGLVRRGDPLGELAVCLVLLWALGGWVVFSVAGPLGAMEQGMREISSQLDLTVRTSTWARDEVGR